MFQTTTDDSGAYRLANLPPGSYEIRAELEGFSTLSREDIAVRAGLHLALDLTMRVGAVNETVRITADSPLLESRNAGLSVNIAGTLQRSLPLSSTRAWYDFLDVTPGVTSFAFSSFAGTPSQAVSVYGAGAQSTITQVDGADLNAAVENSPQQIGFSQDVVADVQIKTAGLDAAAPLGEGGVISVTTKSGTNRLSGSVSTLYQAKSWNDNNQPGGSASDTTIKEPDATIGGPIVPDRLWFFGSYRYLDTATGVSRTAAQLQTLQTLSPGFAPQDLESNGHQYFVKLTQYITRNSLVSGYYQSDRVDYTTVGNPITSSYEHDQIGGPAAAVRLSATPASKMALRLGASYNSKRRNIAKPDIDAPFETIYQTTSLSGSTLVGNTLLANVGASNSSYTETPYYKYTISGDADFTLGNFLGTHDLSAGVYLQPLLHREMRNHFVNGGYSRVFSVLRNPNDLAGGTVPFYRQINDPENGIATSSNNSDNAVYIQDQWRPTVRLTANLGLRIDRVRAHDEIFDVTTEHSTAIGPRFGIRYLLTGDGRNSVRAMWTRVHEGPLNAGAGVGTVRFARVEQYDLDLNGSFETNIVTPATSALAANQGVDNNLGQPHADDLTLGYQTQLPSHVAIDVNFIRRKFLDRFTALEINRLYENNVFRGYKDISQSEIYRLTNNTWNWPVYTGLGVSITRQTSTLQLIASYMRQWRHLDGTWQPDDLGSFIQPTTFSNSRSLGSTTGSFSPVNGLSGTDMALTLTGSQWVDHVARVGVSYHAPWDLLLASDFVVQSGPWSGPIIMRVSAADPQFGPPSITLSNGRLATNPLATINRFAFPSRTDGQFQLPTYQRWNVRIGRRFRIRGVNLELAGNVFNLTNHAADQGLQSGGNQLYSASYGLLTGRQPPRAIQLITRVSF